MRPSALNVIAFTSFLLCASIVYARPQWNMDNNRRQNFGPQMFQFPNTNEFPNNNNNNNNGINNDSGMSSTVTQATPTTATTASPQYLACLQSCPTTSEYNPVCGSDNINYHNNGRLQCAVRCGKDVVGLRLGTCQPL